LGAPVPLVSGSAGATGAKIAVAKPGDPLDGLTITVPAGAYEGTVPFTVSERPLSTNALADGVTALSPVVVIDNGDVTTTISRVLVRIPAQISSDASGSIVGAYVHEDRTLDLLPVIDSDAGSATVAATHFSQIVLVRVDWSRFGVTADSGFRPGVDDWQFGNYGSYAAPRGHCEGQSLTALWYYTTQRAAGASPLHGLYDNNGADPRTPDFWQDDADGYRFASAIQRARLASAPAEDAAWQAHADYGDRYTFAVFRVSMALTGRPQQVIIATADLASAHAMVVYRVGQQQLFVADPNWPGKYRTIRFDSSTGRFDPYYGGANAGAIAAGKWDSYTEFVFQPVSSRRAEADLAAEWAKFTSNAAGDGAFPAARLIYATGEVDANGDNVWADLGGTLKSEVATLRVKVNPADPMAALAYRLTSYSGTRKQHWSENTDVDVDLAEGSNDIGILIQGLVGNEWTYVDFVRIAVTRGNQPSPAAGGGWMLTGSEASAPNPPAGPGLQISIKDGAYAETSSWTGSQGDVNTVSAAVTWAPPPASMAAGATYAGSIVAKLVCSANASGSLDAAFSALLVKGGQATVPEPAGKIEARLRCSDQSDTADFTWAFPSEGLVGGEQLDVVISWNGASAAGYTYHYVWKP
jgi:hypothetical protein